MPPTHTNPKAQKPLFKEEMEIVMQFSETFSNAEILSPKTKTIENDDIMPINNRILVIENDEISALIINELLYRLSVSFTFVTNIKEGIIEIEKQPFKTIFLGINDPINFDPDLFNKINNKSSKTTKTIIIGLATQLTQNAMSNDLKEFFNHLLVKPYNIKEVTKLFSKYLNTISEKKPVKQLLKLNKPTFSLEQLQQVSNNNQEFVTKMVDKFLTTALECDEVLTTRTLTDYYEKLQKLSHKCIPSYSIMGLNQLVKYLEYIEKNALLGKETSLIEEKIKLFVAENKMVISDIKDFLNQKRT
ncbi:MAG: hypothetical protein H7141_07750 [Burkholderiales bacterium]|nr:hypothetical protein [Bacteroidia bacterium]